MAAVADGRWPRWQRWPVAAVAAVAGGRCHPALEADGDALRLILVAHITDERPTTGHDRSASIPSPYIN